MFTLSALQLYIISVAGFSLLFIMLPRKKAKYAYVFLLFAFTALAYHLNPAPTDDIATYFNTLDTMREQGKNAFKYALESEWYDWNTYRVCAFYFYLISFLPNNHFLPAITIFIVYSINFYVILKASERFKIEKWHLFFASLFMISTYWFYDTASGIRNGLAFAIAIGCIYQHLVERKHIILCFVGYGLSIFMHSAGIIPIAIAILAEITLNTSGIFLNMFLVFGIAGGGALIQFLAQNTNIGFLNSLAGQVESHAAISDIESGTMFRVNLATLIFVSFIFVYLYYYLQRGEYANDVRRFVKFSSFLVFFMFGSIFTGLVFVRIARWILPVIGSLIFMIGMQVQYDDIQNFEGGTIKSSTATLHSALTRYRYFIYLLYIVYIAVHFWYDFNGSSLIWFHF